jgi:hypothetical protein
MAVSSPCCKKARLTVPTLLANLHPHARDAAIHFNEDSHVYTINGQRVPESVSGFWARFFPEFDAEAVIAKNFANWSTVPTSPYFRLIHYLKHSRGFNEQEAQAEIARYWRQHGLNSAQHGTNLHRAIEYHLNGMVADIIPQPEFGLFEKWFAQTKERLGTPYRTEWSLYSEEAALAGQLDSLFHHPVHGFTLVDWKCVKALPSGGGGNFRKVYGRPPFNMLENHNLSHYWVQQNMYSWMLRAYYGINVERMLLVQLHDSLTEAIEHIVPDLQTYVVPLMQERIQAVQMGTVTFPKKHHEERTKTPCAECHELRALVRDLMLCGATLATDEPKEPEDAAKPEGFGA